MSYISIAKTMSAVLIVGAAVAWLAFIIRRRVATGPMTPLQSRDWFLDVFKGGLTIMRRCRWLLIIPLAAAGVQFCESLFWTSLYLNRNPAMAKRFSQREPEQLSEFLKLLIRDIPGDFLETAGEIDDVMLHVLRSPVVLGAFLLLVMIIVLRSRNNGTGVAVDDSHRRAPKWLGALSGLTGAVFLVIPILQNLLFKNEMYSSWIYVGVVLAFLIALPFAYALLIPAMDAADRGSALSFTAGLSTMERYFRPLFGYVLVSSAVVQIVLLPSSVHLLLDPYHEFDLDGLWLVKGALMCTLLAMISFVPVIVVVRRESLASALDGCVELWARHAKNAAVFILIGALLLLIPVMLEGKIYRLFSSHVGWEIKTLQVVLSLCKVAVGVLVMSSMVVFYKKIQESEKGSL